MTNLTAAITTEFIILTVVAIVFLFLLIAIITMLIKSASCKKPVINTAHQTVDLNVESLKRHLIGAIKIPTISPESLEQDTSVFNKFEDFLKDTFPLIHKIGVKKVINSHALIFKINASIPTALLPIGFLAHQDVVPVDPNEWDYAPFGGETDTENGIEYIYGRGAIDMKVHLLAVMESVEYLLSVNHSFERDVYMCFGFDEELSGRMGAFQIVNYLQEQNIRFEYILDEGGVITDGSMLGIDGNIALIGNSEKGYADFTLKAVKNGGHSSNPVHPTSIEVLAKGITRLTKKPFPTRWTVATIELLDALAPHMKQPYKFICANRKVFSPLLKFVLSKTEPSVEAVLRTTIAPTKIKGSDGYNIISRSAKVNVNCRLLAGDTKESVIAHIKKAVGKDVSVEWQPFTGYDEPSKISSANSSSFSLLRQAINMTFDKLIPAPMPFIGGSDAKFYYPIAENVYRFSPYPLEKSDAKRIHSANERMAVKNLAPAVNFFINLIKISK